MLLKERLEDQRSHILEVKSKFISMLSQKGLTLPENPTFQQIIDKVNEIEVFEWDLENPIQEFEIYTSDNQFVSQVIDKYLTEVSPYTIFEILEPTARYSAGTWYRTWIYGSYRFEGATYSAIYAFNEGYNSPTTGPSIPAPTQWAGRFKFTKLDKTTSVAVKGRASGEDFYSGSINTPTWWKVSTYGAIPKS